MSLVLRQGPRIWLRAAPMLGLEHASAFSFPDLFPGLARTGAVRALTSYPAVHNSDTVPSLNRNPPGAQSTGAMPGTFS